MIEIKSISKTFHNKNILNQVSFSMKPGQITVLTGKSGAGKSTILRCLSGLETYDQGEILIQDDSKKPGQIGLVFQNFNLFPHLSILENVMLPLVHVLNLPREQAKKEALEFLELVELTHKVESYPHELSGGQQQRVAIARACAMKPDVLCFDEPTSALDSQTIDKVISLLLQLKKKGLTQLIVTHDLHFANQIADQLITLERGIIIEQILK